MKSWLTVIVTFAAFQTTPVFAQSNSGFGDLITAITTIGGGVIGNRTCRNERGVVQLFCTGAGAGLGYILGRAVTDHDESTRVQYFNDCMNAYNCRRGQLSDSGYFVEFRQGQRVYMAGRPNLQCRSYMEVVTDRRGRPRHQQTKYACYDARAQQWSPIPQDYYGRMHFYDGPQYSADMRRWNYGAPPAVLPPVQQRPPVSLPPPIIGGPVNGNGGYYQTRPAPPVIAGPARPAVTNPPPATLPPVNNGGQRPLPPPILPYNGGSAVLR